MLLQLKSFILSVSGCFAHAGFDQDSRIWRRREVHRPPYHPRLSHPSRWGHFLWSSHRRYHQTDMLSCWAYIQSSLCRLPLHQFKEWEESGSDFTCSVRVRGSEGLCPRHVRRWASGEMCWDQKPQIPAGPRQTLVPSLPQTSLKPCPIPSATSTWWSREPISWLLSLWRRAERTRGTKRWVWTFKIHGWQFWGFFGGGFATAVISRLCFRLFFFKSPYD